MSRLATDVSFGKPDVPELTVSGSDEIAALSASFNRMRRSFEGALKMLPKSRPSVTAPLSHCAGRFAGSLEGESHRIAAG
jgi:hypothetical protein